MTKNDIEKRFPIDSYLIYTSKYGETSGIQVYIIKYRKLYNNTYSAYIRCRAKNNKYFFHEYSVYECSPDINMNRKMKLKRLI